MRAADVKARLNRTSAGAGDGDPDESSSGVRQAAAEGSCHGGKDTVSRMQPQPQLDVTADATASPLQAAGRTDVLAAEAAVAAAIQARLARRHLGERPPERRDQRRRLTRVGPKQQHLADTIGTSGAAFAAEHRVGGTDAGLAVTSLPLPAVLGSAIEAQPGAVEVPPGAAAGPPHGVAGGGCVALRHPCLPAAAELGNASGGVTSGCDVGAFLTGRPTSDALVLRLPQRTPSPAPSPPGSPHAGPGRSGSSATTAQAVRFAAVEAAEASDVAVAAAGEGAAAGTAANTALDDLPSEGSPRFLLPIYRTSSDGDYSGTTAVLRRLGSGAAVSPVAAAAEAALRTTHGSVNSDMETEASSAFSLSSHLEDSLEPSPSSPSIAGRRAVSRYGSLFMSSAGWRYTAMYDMHDVLLLSKVSEQQRRERAASALGAASVASVAAAAVEGTAVQPPAEGGVMKCGEDEEEEEDIAGASVVLEDVVELAPLPAEEDPEGQAGRAGGGGGSAAGGSGGGRKLPASTSAVDLGNLPTSPFVTPGSEADESVCRRFGSCTDFHLLTTSGGYTNRHHNRHLHQTIDPNGSAHPLSAWPSSSWLLDNGVVATNAPCRQEVLGGELCDGGGGGDSGGTSSGHRRLTATGSAGNTAGPTGRPCQPSRGAAGTVAAANEAVVPDWSLETAQSRMLGCPAAVDGRLPATINTAALNPTSSDVPGGLPGHPSARAVRPSLLGQSLTCMSLSPREEGPEQLPSQPQGQWARRISATLPHEQMAMASTASSCNGTVLSAHPDSAAGGGSSGAPQLSRQQDPTMRPRAVTTAEGTEQQQKPAERRTSVTMTPGFGGGGGDINSGADVPRSWEATLAALRAQVTATLMAPPPPPPPALQSPPALRLKPFMSSSGITPGAVAVTAANATGSRSWQEGRERNSRSSGMGLVTSAVVSLQKLFVGGPQLRRQSVHDASDLPADNPQTVSTTSNGSRSATGDPRVSSASASGSSSSKGHGGILGRWSSSTVVPTATGAAATSTGGTAAAISPSASSGIERCGPRFKGFHRPSGPGEPQPDVGADNSSVISSACYPPTSTGAGPVLMGGDGGGDSLSQSHSLRAAVRECWSAGSSDTGAARTAVLQTESGAAAAAAGGDVNIRPSRWSTVGITNPTANNVTSLATTTTVAASAAADAAATPAGSAPGALASRGMSRERTAAAGATPGATPGVTPGATPGATLPSWASPTVFLLRHPSLLSLKPEGTALSVNTVINGGGGSAGRFHPYGQTASLPSGVAVAVAAATLAAAQPPRRLNSPSMRRHVRQQLTSHLGATSASHFRGSADDSMYGNGLPLSAASSSAAAPSLTQWSSRACARLTDVNPPGTLWEVSAEEEADLSPKLAAPPGPVTASAAVAAADSPATVQTLQPSLAAPEAAVGHPTEGAPCMVAPAGAADSTSNGGGGGNSGSGIASGGRDIPRHLLRRIAGAVSCGGCRPGEDALEGVGEPCSTGRNDAGGSSQGTAACGPARLPVASNPPPPGNAGRPWPEVQQRKRPGARRQMSWQQKRRARAQQRRLALLAPLAAAVLAPSC